MVGPKKRAPSRPARRRIRPFGRPGRPGLGDLLTRGPVSAWTLREMILKGTEQQHHAAGFDAGGNCDRWRATDTGCFTVNADVDMVTVFRIVGKKSTQVGGHLPASLAKLDARRDGSGGSRAAEIEHPGRPGRGEAGGLRHGRIPRPRRGGEPASITLRPRWRSAGGGVGSTASALRISARSTTTSRPSSRRATTLRSLQLAAGDLADALNEPPSSPSEAILVIADARAAMQHRWTVDGMNAAEAKAPGPEIRHLVRRDHPIRR